MGREAGVPTTHRWGDKHHREGLADIGLKGSELAPEAMMRSAECNEIFECVCCLGVISTVRIDEFSPRPDVVNMKLGSTVSVVLGLIDITTRRLTAVVVTLKHSVELSSPARISALLSLPLNSLSL
ncbi:hypothetical protein C494_06675 [Natronorubrum bangense JCM 10635]|uniref:Uncharacterized protein n=1 Tax=Natronorubrum bangense JCM 10635 TaxID=1227500 RepID=L9WMW1_9EURY|nr:hypothetical protein C494_06675 [Natronorubrum bangense JCM 10635]